MSEKVPFFLNREYFKSNCKKKKTGCLNMRFWYDKQTRTKKDYSVKMNEDMTQDARLI